MQAAGRMATTVSVVSARFGSLRAEPAQRAASGLVGLVGPVNAEADQFSFTATVAATDTGPATVKRWPASDRVTGKTRAISPAGTGGVSRACIGRPDGGVELLTRIRANAIAGDQEHTSGTCNTRLALPQGLRANDYKTCPHAMQLNPEATQRDAPPPR